MQYLSFLLASVLLCTVSLPQFSGAGTRKLLAGFILAFIVISLINLFAKLLINQSIKSFFSQLKIRKIDLAILLIALSAFISTISSYFFHESLVGFAKYILYFLFYICICSIANSKSLCKGLILALLIGLLWSNIEGLRQAFWGAEALATWEDPNVHFSKQLNRVYSNFLNPNLYGAYLISLWPFSLFFIPHLMSQKNKTNIQKLLSSFGIILSTVLAIISIYLILQTGSRGAWLSLSAQLLIAGIAILIFVKSKIVSVGFWGTAVISSLYFVSKPSFFNRVLSIFSSYEHSSNSFRLNVWKACGQMFADNPLFGIGPGSESFYQAYGIYSDSIHSSLGAYSLPIEIAVEMGLFGVISFLFFIFTIFISGIETLKRFTKIDSLKQSEDLVLILIGLISLTGLLINGLFDIVILRPQIQIVLWTIVAIVRFSTNNTKVKLNND
ncbi:MAG: O-antigen ligase family protein [Candidatus Caenarcaniphilales bacterium]|nr:O-antigen ligase family protein [Candidatus Caenarcaniphilales bacterium]